MRIVKLTFVILLASVFSGCQRGGIGGAGRGAIDVFVSPDGDDGADGTKERPFATIVRARDAVRQLRRDGAVGAKVHRNIIYAGSDKDFFYDMKAGLLDLARPDYNLIYCKDRQKGERLLAEARKAGHEKHGVFAEPMFADLENGDLRLKAGSAALELGVRQIDTSKIGLLDDPAFVRLRREGFRKAVDTEGSIDF